MLHTFDAAIHVRQVERGSQDIAVRIEKGQRRVRRLDAAPDQQLSQQQMVADSAMQGIRYNDGIWFLPESHGAQ